MTREEIGYIDASASLPAGQWDARTRWGTHASGAAFDRKKAAFLTEQAQEFIAQQSFCVIAGLDIEDELVGSLVLGTPGFVQILDSHTCLLRLDGHLGTSRILQRLHQSSWRGQVTRLGLFFICHPTRERLCVHGRVELLPSSVLDVYGPIFPQEGMWVCLHVEQSFFHCSKYMRTRVPGLTHPVVSTPEQMEQWQQLCGYSRPYISQEIRVFIAEQLLCFLCTVDRHGQGVVNHRGGSRGFLLSLPPDAVSPGGTILLPDYSGNGAFEALGNILETGHATLIIPNYVAQLALYVSGSARILELKELSAQWAQRCVGAERVIALSVQHVETQSGDWAPTLAYERARSELNLETAKLVAVCPIA